MSNSIEIEGFEELEELIQGMTLTDADERKAMKLALEPIANEIENNTPERTGKLKKLKVSISKEEFATVGKIKLGAFYDIFQEFGTSKQRAHVGFFERSVNKTQNEAIRILADNLLNKVV